LNATQWTLAALTVCGLAAGQLLFKLAATQSVAGLSVAGIALGGHLLAGLAVYAVATALWLLLLRDTPLTLAYPVVALAYIVVPPLAYWVLGEPLRWQTLAGGLLIVVGVAVSVRGG